MSQSFKYSTAPKAGFKEFWSQKIAFVAILQAIRGIGKSVRGLIGAFTNDPNESHWTLY